MESERIPLFPLEVVLFPGTPLPLHIFEPRYKLMIQRCLENHQEFGVILARQDGIAAVGCTAAIVQVLQKYPDGQMDILTSGQTAYRALELFEEQPYLEATVEFLKDEDKPAVTKTQEQLLELYAKCHAVLYGRAPQPPENPPNGSLAFEIASQLPLDLENKQELLELRAEPERQTRLLEQMNAWLPQLALLDRTRRKAGGNGHGLH